MAKEHFARRILFIVAATAAIVGLSGCDVVGGGNAEIFRAPPNGADSKPLPPPEPSSITLAIDLPYASLQALVASQTAGSQQFSGSSRLACVAVPYFIGPKVGSHQQCGQVPYCDFRGCGTQEQCINVPDVTGPSVGTADQCVDFNWQATAMRESDPTVAKSGDAIRVALPIHVTGQGGLNGDLARLLSLSAKNFEVHATPQVDVTLAMTEQWCPVVTVTPTNNWVTGATVEVVGRSCVGVNLGVLGSQEACAGPANIDLTGQANQAVSAQQGQIAGAVNSALSCDAMRASVQSAWHGYSIPIGKIGNADAVLNITPQSASVSDFIAQDSAIRLVVSMQAVTEIGTSAIATGPIALPQLGRTSNIGSGIQLHVRAIAPYSALNDVLSADFKGKDFTANTGAGDVRVHVNDTTVYPSGAALAIGLNISVKLPGQVLDTSGWVYLIGKPVAGSQGQTLEVQDLRYAEVLDNKLWNTIAQVFNSKIIATLREHAVVDLRPAIENATNQVVAGMAGATVPGFKLVPGAPSIALEDVAVAQEGFVAVAGLKMPLRLEATQSLLVH